MDLRRAYRDDHVAAAPAEEVSPCDKVVTIS
jgi:hypothetical protein